MQANKIPQSLNVGFVLSFFLLSSRLLFFLSFFSLSFFNVLVFLKFSFHFDHSRCSNSSAYFAFNTLFAFVSIPYLRFFFLLINLNLYTNVFFFWCICFAFFFFLISIHCISLFICFLLCSARFGKDFNSFFPLSESNLLWVLLLRNAINSRFFNYTPSGLFFSHLCL